MKCGHGWLRVSAMSVGCWAAALSGGCRAPGADSNARQATLIFEGGTVLTLDDNGSVAEALAVANDRIVAIGSREEIATWKGPDTEQIDLGGGTLMPAFIDHHVHLLNMGMSLLWAGSPSPEVVDLAGVTSQQEVGQRLAERARSLPPGSWLIGKGWSQAAWGSDVLPDHRALSAQVPDNPVFLTRVDGHASWVNAETLRLAGIDASTPDPAGGSIRHLADGEPSGVLLERANESVTALVPPPDDATILSAFRLATDALAAQGVTEVFDAGFLRVPGIVDLGLDLERYLQLLVRLDQERPLAVRVNLMIPAPSGLATRLLDDPDYTRAYSPRLRITHLKLFMDGAMGSRGAWLSHPYADDPSTHGVPRMQAEELFRIALAAVDSGLDVATHVIGDEAVAQALDVYAEILAARPDLAAGRLRLEHFSYAGADDFARAARMGIVLSIQPNFVYPDDAGNAMEDARVGTDNSARVYAWGRLQKDGARLAFGSDYFTLPFAPLYSYYAAVTRSNPSGLPETGWHPGERLDRLTALELSTTLNPPGGATDEVVGLTPGRLADLVVLSGDPLSVAPDDLLDITVEATYLAGTATSSQALER